MEALVRYRPWVVMSVLLAVVIVAALLAGRSGGGSGETSVHVRFGPLVKPPVGPGQLTFTNGWVASSGRARVAVYVGSQPHHPRNGMIFETVRVPGEPRIDLSELISGTGALTLLRPPLFSNMRAAAQATLRLVTANGNTESFSVERRRFSRNG
jgi:hypothetical protein